MTHEKLKAQIEDQNVANSENQALSINSAGRIFSELMENTIKNSMNSENSFTRQGFKSETRKSPPANAEAVVLSGRADKYGGSREMKSITNIITSSPEIRLNKANDVLRRITEGTYETDYLIIADKLLSHDLVMRI